MRLLISRTPLRRILRWTQVLLVTGGVGALAYCGYVLVDSWMFQRAEQHRLDRLLAERQAAPAPISSQPAPSPGGVIGLIGRIEIPRIGVSVIVMEGTTKITLRRAAGHIEGTALPGEPGNVAIAAHRDTFFRPLRNIREGDAISITTPDGTYRYHVVSATIVGPTDVDILAATAGQSLTLVTCYPFSYVGSAPDRFVVRAVR